MHYRLETVLSVASLFNLNTINSRAMRSVEVIIVDNKKVSCDGHSTSSRHPLVYLNMGEKDHIICPYCSRCFSMQKDDSNSEKHNS